MKLDPAVIFMYDSANPQFTQSKVWKNLSAVRNQRVYRVDMTWREGGTLFKAMGRHGHCT